MTPSSAPPAVGAIVVNHESSALARECVASIAAQARDVGGIETVVVDSGSSEPERAALREVGAPVVLLDGNPGYAAAVNRGARETRGRYLLVSNPDVLYLPGALVALVNAADRLERCAAVGPTLWWDRERTLLLPPNSDESAATVLRDAAKSGRGELAVQRWARRTQPVRDATGAIELPALSGASMLIPRSAFEDLGGLDEGFTLYFEDADFCRRARSSGYRLALVPGADVVHHYNQSAARDPQAAAHRFAESARRYHAKHEHPETRLLADRADARLLGAAVPAMVDLGVAAEAPRLNVAGDAAMGPTLFLLSPFAGCVPAAAAQRPTGELVVPAEVFRRCAPGPWHAVALAQPDLRVVGAWRWMKEPVAEVAGGQAATPEIAVRDCQPGDAEQVTRLFAKAFGHELWTEAWLWKYFGIPGIARSQVAEIDRTVVAHIGCRRHRMAWLGRPVLGFAMADQMSDPAIRGRPVWQATSERLFEQHVDGQGGVLSYGFPNERIRRAGEARQSWEPVAPVFVLERAQLDPAPRLPGELLVSNRPPHDWDAAWARLEPTDGLLLRRDHEYLTWRYTDRPDREYRFLNARDGGSLAVLMVGQAQAQLMELIAPKGDAARLARLALAAEHIAAGSGSTSLGAWFAPWSEQARVLAAACGFAGHDAPHYLECSRRDPRAGLDWLAAHFFYSLGDWDVH